MKKLSLPMIAAVAGLLIASAGQAKAGGTDACCSGSHCGDGIAASPKVRATLDERCTSCCTTSQAGKATTTRQTEVAASPKVQQMRAERGASATAQSAEVAGYKPTGADGITASPKARAQLDERRQTVEIAPLK
jgi:hypothetical protein